MIHRALAVSLLVVAAAAPQITEKEAQKQLKDAAKQAGKDFKEASKDARDTADDAIDAFEDLVKDGGFSDPGMQGVVNDVADAHEAIRMAYDAALNAIATAGSQALEDLAGPEGLDGHFPDGFYERDRGTLDKAKAGLAKQAAKIAKKLNKDLSKLAKRLEKDANVGMSHVVLPVKPLFDVTFNQSQIVDEVLTLTSSDLSVDLVIAWADLPVEGSGQVWAAGNGFDNDTTFAAGKPNDSAGSKSITDADSRWIGIGSFTSSNIVVSVFQDEDGDFAGPGQSVAISLR